MFPTQNILRRRGFQFSPLDDFIAADPSGRDEVVQAELVTQKECFKANAEATKIA